MFYYPAVLKRHSGCFSTIWLVATKGIKVPRRDFLKVNVKSTCDDIMDYVLERVPAPQPGLPRPRFSLYLSSQLQYGIILVYHRQCAILLEELQSVVGQLLKQRSFLKIDMDDHSKQALVLPDALSLMEEVEGAPDPLFGVMHLQDLMPSPSTLIEMDQEYLKEASPQLPKLPSPAAPAAKLENGITASPDTITLRELEPVAIPSTEFEGEDLIDSSPDVIDFLLAQTDHFPEGSVELPREELAPREKEKTKELTESTTELQPTTVSSEDAMLLPQQKPAEMSPRVELTPVFVPAIPSPPSAQRKRERRLQSLEDLPPEVEVKKKRRRRKLVFFDSETQLSQEEQQRQINNPLTETRRPLLPLPSTHMVHPASELLNNPCSFLPEEIQFLWRRVSTIKPVLGVDLLVGERGPESSDSEREREMMEVADREEQRLELSPKEVQREMLEPEILYLSDQGILPLETSDQRELSREISPIVTSEREGSTVSRSVSMLQDIPEVVDVTTEIEAAEFPRLLPESPELQVESVLFHSLLPPELDRRAVSNIFQRLLVNLTAGNMRAEQDEPYGDILIFPGSNYQEMDQAT
ncbi:meiotic recombination protein REC8 homolog isoform X2 [Melanotaenia boesemani]|uniref:meiotic recombination protein REC8 homolog isoform X2 n=1 Tax=Melanotaenia boesemani TaxID=1250792 RepID=UPI001C047A36|nr:meiotic recombination protein REC8 homolog isoform X2 [Melanotaenia boesemani]